MCFPVFRLLSGILVAFWYLTGPLLSGKLFWLVRFWCHLLVRRFHGGLNSGKNFKLEGENVTGYRYMLHLYCHAVQACIYSDMVECRTFESSRPGSIPSQGTMLFQFFHLFHIFCLKVEDMGINLCKGQLDSPNT